MKKMKSNEIRVTKKDFSPEALEKQLEELAKGSGHNQNVKNHMKFYSIRQWEMFQEALI